MGEFRLRDLSVASRGRYAMPVVSPLQARVATPPVSMHFAAGFHAVPHKSSQAAPRGIRNVAQANPPHSFSAPFHGYRDQALPDQLASADASFRASQVRLVNFHQARDSFPIQASPWRRAACAAAATPFASCRVPIRAANRPRSALSLECRPATLPGTSRAVGSVTCAAPCPPLERSA